RGAGPWPLPGGGSGCAWRRHVRTHVGHSRANIARAWTVPGPAKQTDALSTRTRRGYRMTALPPPTTLCEAFQRVAAIDPGATAVRTWDGSVSLTWAQYAQRVRSIAAGLHRLGVRHGDTVGLMLLNRPEFYPCDVAVLHLGGTPFSIYNTSSPEQIAH